jgi:hypothetical protein
MTERRIIVDHVLFVVENLEASRRLYTAALAPLGFVELDEQDDGVHYGAEGWTTSRSTGARLSPPRRTWRSRPTIGRRVLRRGARERGGDAR